MKQLSEKQMLFIEHYSSTGNGTQSAIKAGYSEKSARQQAHYLQKQLSSEIETYTREMLASQAPVAIEKLRQLISDPKIPASTALGACNSILDRTGYQTVIKHEEVTDQKSEEQLRAELDYILRNIAVNSIPEDKAH